MKISTEEINEAMKLYLGGGDDSGYDPLRKEERLKNKYGNNWEDIEITLLGYLEPVMQLPVDWEQETLMSASARIKKLVDEKYPWLDQVTRAKVANWWSYQWK